MGQPFPGPCFSRALRERSPGSVTDAFLRRVASRATSDVYWIGIEGLEESNRARRARSGLLPDDPRRSPESPRDGDAPDAAS